MSDRDSREPDSTRPESSPASIRPPTRRLILAGLAVLVLMGACGVGGYLLGRHEPEPAAKGRQSVHLTTSRDALDEVRTDMRQIIRRLYASNRRLEEQKRVLVIRISRLTAVRPQL